MKREHHQHILGTDLKSETSLINENHLHSILSAANTRKLMLILSAYFPESSKYLRLKKETSFKASFYGFCIFYVLYMFLAII